ncbi:MAG: class I SAM-dependent methyltransferase [Acidobacteria bacterium]|nr:class I SAM-dependent methyltransferase [Acidobacteriota bacterium]MBI3655858.1 class I SAM-dependent methyltransferase [Acidobacteriota bacterium]
MGLEKITCPVCGNDSGKTILTVPDRLGHFSGQFPLIECAGCRLAYVNPRPDGETLENAYSSAAAEIISQFNSKRVNKQPRFERDYINARRFIDRVDRLRPIRPDTVILDVGCGNGAFLYYAQLAKPFRPLGVDIGKPFVEYARRELGIEVHLGRLADCRFPDGSIDVLRLWHVLEHLEKPLELLAEFRRILKSDGLLVLQVPCYGSLLAKIFGRNWIFHFIPFHVYQFTPDSITSLLNKAGWEVVDIEGSLMPLELSGSLFYCFGGNLMALMRRKIENRRRPRWSRILNFTLFWGLFLTLGIPYLMLEFALLYFLAHFKRAGNITVYCRKQP